METGELRGHAGRVLDDLRVADFSRVLAGPYATMLLADFGADVIKVESPAGDDTRSWRPPVGPDGGSTYFASVNRGKRSVVCDFTTPDGLARARRLALSADVVVENFRPGTLARFGLDHASLAAARPGLVSCSITGFGAGSDLPGYDLLVQALGGLMSITGDPAGPPTKAGVALVDVLTGQNAVVGILLALRERDRTGLGQHVEVSLLGSLLSALVNQAAAALATGEAPARLGSAHPSIAPYALFRAADRELVIAVGNDHQFAALAGVLGDSGIAADPRFSTNPDRVAHRDELTTELERRLAVADAAHWVERLGAVAVPAGTVNTIPEAIALAESLGLAPVAPGGGSIADPIRLSATPARPVPSAPRLGEHDAAWWRAERPELDGGAG